MKISLLLSFLFAAISVSAQVNPQCPTISIDGPAGIPAPGEPYIYTVNVKPTESKLTYKWTLSHGTITAGQGTPSIQLRIGSDETIPTVTVEVGGLPQECPSRASEITIVDPAPQAQMIAKFTGQVETINKESLRKVAAEAGNNPNSQLYIIIGSHPLCFRSVSYKIASELNLEDYRVTFIDWPSKTPFMEVWLVPPGATPPTCKDCEAPYLGPLAKGCSGIPTESRESVEKEFSCPSVEIVGPERISMPGTLLTFHSKVYGPHLNKTVRYKWSVSAGAIVKGQGTSKITVRAPNGDVAVVRAFLQISGFPLGCKNSVTEVAGIANQPLVDPYGRYGDISLETEKEKLRNAFTVLAKYPTFKLLLVKRSPKNTSKNGKRIDEIRSFVADELKISPSRFQLATIAGDEIETVIWFVKPGTNVAALIGGK
jgi:hypothetical protein